MFRRTFAVCLLIAAGCGIAEQNPCSELPYETRSAVTTLFIAMRDSGMTETRIRLNALNTCDTEAGPNGSAYLFPTSERCLLCYDSLIDDVYH